jgi:glycerate kinase
VPRGGAAGGVAAGLHALLGAERVGGIDHFLHLTRFDAALVNAALVITGEGCIDEQTLGGKAPFGVARRARAHGAAVLVLAGQVPLAASPALREMFDVLLAIGERPAPLVAAVRVTAANLERSAFELGTLLSLGAMREIPAAASAALCRMEEPSCGTQ